MAKKNKDRKKPDSQGNCKKCGITLQIMICIFNGLIWIISVALIGIGFAAGLYSRTIGMGENFNFNDLIITTPATILIFYGVPLFIVGIAGCFASVSGNICCTLFYMLLIGGFITFDIMLGLAMVYQIDSYTIFLDAMKESQNLYDDEKAKSYGIIPSLSPSPTVFWDHIQTKGVCCGLRNYNEWKNTPFGKNTMSIPDSCCVADYKYLSCGDLLWEHPPPEWHARSSVINKEGCLSTFPSFMQSDSNQYIDWTGKAIFAMLVFCLLLATVLVLLVAIKAFRPAQGLANPDFMDVPIQGTCQRKCRANRKVGPEPPDFKNLEQNKSVSFDETGPKIVPNN